MRSSNKSKLQRRRTRANARRLVLLSPLTSELRSRRAVLVSRPLLPQPPPPPPPKPPLPPVPLSALLVRFRPPFLQVMSMLLPSESRPQLLLRPLLQCNIGDWGTTWIFSLHNRTPGDRYPSQGRQWLCEWLTSTVSVSYDSIYYPMLTYICSPVFNSVLSIDGHPLPVGTGHSWFLKESETSHGT